MVRHVQIFENSGAMMGASNPHPHGQIWANERIPNEPARSWPGNAPIWTNTACLLCDYLAAERRAGERVVEDNGHFVAVVSFWAVWPYETLVLPAHTAAPCPTCPRTSVTAWPISCGG